MKAHKLAFLIAPIMFAGVLFFSSYQEAGACDDKWVDSSDCVASECGTSLGTKTQELYKEVCTYSCPVIHFEWKTKDYRSCPPGYSVRNGHIDQCKKDHNPNKGNIIPRLFDVTNHSADVVYNKSMDPHKCHRPSDSTLRDVYGMNHDAIHDFKDDNREWKFSKESCENILIDTRTVDCNDAEVIACYVTCESTVLDPLSEVWSEWKIDNEDTTQEVRIRSLIYLDLKDGVTICETIPEKQSRYLVCSLASEVVGEWSEWAVDPSDSAREIRTRTITLVDDETSELCDSYTENEYKDIIIEEPEDEPEEEPVDDGDVLGEDDEKEEVTADVLSAETGGGDSLVIVVEALLILASLSSLVHTAKKYIIG